MKYLSLLVLGLAVVTTKPAVASTLRSIHAKPDNLVLWCGATTGEEKAKFPYLAAIKNYKLKNGHPVQVATVYEKGKLILRQYVYRQSRPHAVAYESAGDIFSLNLKNDRGASSWAEFKAVIHDSDGTKLIGNGSIPCYLHGKRS